MANNDYYWVETAFGDHLATFPYTVDGFYDACVYHEHRLTNGRDSFLKSTANMNFDNPSGLSAKEKEIVEEKWGVLP